MTRALLLDIEGTTSSLAFVRKELFPYARAHLRAFVSEHRHEPEVQRELAEVTRLARAEGSSADDPVRELERWMAEDRKATPLKALQGLLWQRAFQRGVFVAHVYPEVPAALARAREQGLALHVYSSGSVRAQQAFFRHSAAGDLTPLVAGWFDTTIGSKLEAASYRKIAAAIGQEPREILFLSDSLPELDAARAAGLETLAVLRGPHALGAHAAVTRFDELPLSPPAGEARASDPVARGKAEVVALARHCHERGWASATSGNFSVRIGGERIAITATGIDKARVTPGDVLLLAPDGTPLEPGRPSAEAPLHVELYRSRADVGAVAHTHSVAATVLSRHFASRGVLRLSSYEMAKALAPVKAGEPPELNIPILENQQDTLALAQHARAQIEKSQAFAYLVEGHGLTTWGRDVAEVRRQVEALEFMLACELARFTAGALTWRNAG